MKRSKILEPFSLHSMDLAQMSVGKYNTKKRSSNPSGSQSGPQLEVIGPTGTIWTHRPSLAPCGTVAGDPQSALASTGNAGDNVFSSFDLFTPDPPSLAPEPVSPEKPHRIRNGYRCEKASAWRHW